MFERIPDVFWIYSLLALLILALLIIIRAAFIIALTRDAEYQRLRGKVRLYQQRKGKWK